MGVHAGGACPVVPAGAAAAVHLRGDDVLGQAQALLRELFAEGLDPVVATARLIHATARPHRVLTRFAGWVTPRPVDPLHRYRPRERLDRKLAKQDAVDLVRLLGSQSERRVGVAVAPGLPGQEVDRFGDQLEKHLKTTLAGEAYVVERLPLEPAPPGDTEADLRAALTAALGAPPTGETLAAAARRLTGSLRERKVVLLVDWGVLGEGAHRAYTQTWVDTLCRWSARELHDACPPELRVVHLVTVVADERYHPAIRQSVEDAPTGLDPRHPRVFPRALHALGLVTESDLRHFLEEPGNSDCQSGDAADVAAPIWRRAGGGPGREADFGSACDELEAALEHGWEALAEEGRRQRHRDGGLVIGGPAQPPTRTPS